MFIRYRDRYGRFISKESAARRKPKNVVSELINRKISRGKLQEKTVAVTKGYKVRRFGYRIPPPRKITKKPIVRERRIIRQIVEEIPEEIEEIEEAEEFEPEEGIIGLSEEWSETLGEYPEMSGLDELDWIEDNLDQESEWYEE